MLISFGTLNPEVQSTRTKKQHVNVTNMIIARIDLTRKIIFRNINEVIFCRNQSLGYIRGKM